MRSRSASSLAIAHVSVFAISFYAYGQLGGAAGIDGPFSGFLQDGAAAMNATIGNA